MSVKSTKGNSRGFTLIELLLVISIIAILAAIAIPQFTKYRQGAYEAVLDSDSENAYIAAQAWLVDNPSGTVDSYAKLRTGGYMISPNISYISGNMTIISGSVILHSTVVDDSKNVATLFYNGNVNITAN